MPQQPNATSVIMVTAIRVFRYLVVLSPGPECRGVVAKEGEGVLTADEEEDGEQLQVGDQVTHVPEEEPSESTTKLHLTLKILL